MNSVKKSISMRGIDDLRNSRHHPHFECSFPTANETGCAPWLPAIQAIVCQGVFLSRREPRLRDSDSYRYYAVVLLPLPSRRRSGAGVPWWSRNRYR